MTTDDKPRASFVTVLDEAGAKTCVACGTRAVVRAVLEAAAAAKWFCFECGHESGAIADPAEPAIYGLYHGPVTRSG
jgi:hypothetical protein